MGPVTPPAVCRYSTPYAPRPPQSCRPYSLRITKRLMNFLTRKGFLIEEQGMTYLADSDPDPALGPPGSDGSTYRIALGPRA